MPLIPEFIRPVVGVVDGANQDFETESDYVPGSLVISLNGQLKRADFDDGWLEMGGKKLQMKMAPKVGDVLMATWRPI